MQNKNQNDSINLLDIFFYLLSKWKWFMLFAIIGMLAAYAIYSATSFTYFASATIAIKDPANKAVSASLKSRVITLKQTKLKPFMSSTKKENKS